MGPYFSALGFKNLTDIQVRTNGVLQGVKLGSVSDIKWILLIALEEKIDCLQPGLAKWWKSIKAIVSLQQWVFLK